MEKETRRNNVVVTDIITLGTDSPERQRQVVEQLFKECLDIPDIHVTLVRKCGQKTVVGIGNSQDKFKIMVNKYKLRNWKGQKVFIDNDLTSEEKKYKSK